MNSGGGQGEGGSGLASISAGGRKVACVSSASTFVAGNTNGYNDVYNDVYVKDLAGGAVVRASLSDSGVQGQDDAEEPAISADGTHVAFDTGLRMAEQDTDWTQDVYVRDLTTGTTAMASAQLPGTPASGARGDSYNASLSGDGR